MVYQPAAPDYSYSARDVIQYFDTKEIQNLVLINPDNPSGNYLNAAQVRELFAWAKEKGIKVVYDESFSDFAREEEKTMLREEILSENPHVYVMKSLSKSYGIPGLRLGVLASADRQMIDHLRKSVAIWNINSFAEHFMQIFGKYEKDYAKSTELIARERQYMMQELSGIKGLHVIPSQANFVMVQITEGMSSAKLTELLLEKYDILIKDLGTKLGASYVRIAVRDRADNDALLAAMKDLCGIKTK